MPNHRSIADKLLRKGYRVVSRKYTMIARIDCEPDEYLNRMVKDSCLNVHRYSFFIEEWYDYYRRFLSKDRQEVSPGVVNEMTRSFPTRVFTEIFAATLKDDGTVR